MRRFTESVNPGDWARAWLLAFRAHYDSPTYNSTTDTEVLDGIFGPLDTHKFVFAWLMGLAVALRCVCAFLYQPPVLALGQLWRIDSSSITPKLVRRNQNAQKTRTTAPSLRTQLPLNSDSSSYFHPQSPPEKNVLFAAVHKPQRTAHDAAQSASPTNCVSPLLGPQRLVHNVCACALSFRRARTRVNVRVRSRMMVLLLRPLM